MKQALPILCLLVSAPIALAQNAPANQDINWSADTISADTSNNRVDLTGNVLIAQGDMHMRANSVRMEGVHDNTVEKIFANGQVVLDSPKGTITSDAGVYDVAPRVVTFTGAVVLTSEKNVLRGSALTYNVATGQAKFTAPGKRVQGLFAPPSKANP